MTHSALLYHRLVRRKYEFLVCTLAFCDGTIGDAVGLGLLPQSSYELDCQFHPQAPMCTVEEIRADILAREKET